MAQSEVLHNITKEIVFKMLTEKSNMALEKGCLENNQDVVAEITKAYKAIYKTLVEMDRENQNGN